MAWEEILQTKPSLFFLCLFPAGIQVSLIMGITVKPLKRVESVREGSRQVQQFLSSAHPLSVTAFWSGSTARGLAPRQGIGHKIPHFACPTPLAVSTPRWGSPGSPSVPVPQVSFPRRAPRGARTDTQTQWEPPSGNSNKNMAVYSKRRTHLQRSSLSRKSDALLPSWRQLLSLLCRVTFTSIVLKNKKEKRQKRKETKARRAPYS